MGLCDFAHIPGTIILHDSTMILILIYVTILNPKMFFKILYEFVYRIRLNSVFKMMYWNRFIKCRFHVLSSVNACFLSCIIFDPLLN